MTHNFIQKQAIKLRPDLAETSGIELTSQLLNVYIVMLTIPLLFFGIGWLVFETDFVILSTKWPFFLLLLGIAIVFSRFRFELQFELRPGVLMSSGGTLRFIVVYSAVLIFGPSAVWIGILDTIISGFLNLRDSPDIQSRWNSYAQLMLGAAPGSISILAGLQVYEILGGSYPLSNLQPPTVIAAIILLLVDWLLPYFLLAPVLIYLFRSPELTGEGNTTPKDIILFILFSSALPNLALPFTILGAFLYYSNGPEIYIFFLSGALLANILASRLTDNVQQRTQRARELASLEELGRRIIESPPNISVLSEILSDQIPKMFYQGQCLIWLGENDTIFKPERIDYPEIAFVQNKVNTGNENHYLFTSKNTKLSKNQKGLALPIQNEDKMLLGGVYFRTTQTENDVTSFLPALQALAAQIGSAIFRVEMHNEALQKERMTKELELAGRIQADFLPEETPLLPGYQIAASLTPALQTSGDFYDFIPLPDGKLGVLIADVADKGTGAALFMALTRTLIRTYALEHPDEPELVIKYANDRVMSDTQSQLFVTTFYGVLDPASNTITYVNGGHNPPYMISPNQLEEPLALTRTGIPVGILEETEWTSNKVTIQEDQMIVLYTDGVTEAQPANGELFDDEGLLNAVKANLKKSAEEIHNEIINTIQKHVNNSPQFDDLTLVVIKRSRR